MRVIASLLSAAALGGAALSSVVVAAPRPPPVLTAEDQATVQKAAGYIQGLTSVQGRFNQTSERSGRAPSTSTGTFSMQRPGKARFDYDPPAQLLVVSDGYNVKVFDRKLRTFDQYPLGQTPLVILLAREVRLDRGVVVTGVQRSPGGFAITARDARKQAEGQITLEFADSPTALRGWTVVDAQGVQTRVRLSGLTPTRLDPKLFQLQDPKPHSGPH